MANNLTNAEERRLLDESLDGTYLCLFTADPGEAGAFTNEITGAGYARQAAAMNAAATTGGTTTKTLVGDVSFPIATADYPADVTHVGLASAATAGTLRWFGPLTTPRTVPSGTAFVQRAADTSFGLD